MRYRILISVLFILSLQQINAQVKVQDLRCEMLVDPLGIDVREPRLSWKMISDQRNVRQTSYQIFVASSKELLSKNETDVWNSGNQNSSQSIFCSNAFAKEKSNFKRNTIETM